jgi:hypothetical protein
MMTRYSPRTVAVLALFALAGACGNQSARAPNPTKYVWPDSFAFHLQFDSMAATGVALDESEVLHFVVRTGPFNGVYRVWNDSVVKAVSAAGRPVERGGASAEDTLGYLVGLGRLGEFTSVERDCDPTVGACAEALPSALPVELRRIIPHLPVWWPPRGHWWADTLVFDDLPRPGASRGQVFTYYHVSADSGLADRGYWVVSWHSVRRAWRSEGGTMVAEPERRVYGSVLVDKARLLPVLANWYGGLSGRGGPDAGDAGRTGFRGRAWLVGTAFDSARVVQ